MSFFSIYAGGLKQGFQDYEGIINSYKLTFSTTIALAAHPENFGVGIVGVVAIAQILVALVKGMPKIVTFWV